MFSFSSIFTSGSSVESKVVATIKPLISFAFAQKY
jgi:hypothetical protein